MDFLGLGYVGIATSDIGRWESFARDILGMEVDHDASGESLRLRMDDHAYRYVIRPGEEEEIEYVGWEMAGQEAYEKVLGTLGDLGVEFEEVRGERALDERDVTAYAVIRDPAGYRVEFFYGPTTPVTPFVSKWGSPFVTGRLGSGHFFAAIENFDATVKFYEAIGFQLSDTTQDIVARFYRCTPRQHSWAVCDAAATGLPAGPHHLMVQFEDLDAVGLVYEACIEGGWQLETTLGRHSNDRMFSFYVYTPSGFSMEVGWGGIEVDESTWVQRAWKKGSEWGHRPVTQNALV